MQTDSIRIIDNVLDEYVLRTKKLDQILDKLTRDYCKKSCPGSPVGCCHRNFYNAVPPEMLALQKTEAEQNGWTPNERSAPCKYHEKTGCKIRTYKSPICIGHLCVDLRGQLYAEFGNDSKEFSSHMRSVSHLRLEDRADEIILRMDKAISLGEYLVKKRQEKQRQDLYHKTNS